MKKVQHKDIDNVFKHGLTDPANEPGYQAADWDAMDDMLNEVKTPAKPVYWLRILSGVAAVIVLVAGWWLLAPHISNDTPDKPQVAVKRSRPEIRQDKVDKAVTPIDAAPSTIIEVPRATGPISKAPTQDIAVNAAKSNVPRQNKISRQLADIPAVITDHVPVSVNTLNTPKKDLNLPQKFGIKLNNDADLPSLAATTVAVPPIATIVQPISSNWADDDEAGQTSRLKRRSGNGPQLALSFIAAPEVNGTNALSGSSRGTNIGLVFSVGVNKFTFSTGAMYTVKPYSANGGNYYTSPSYYKYGKPVTPQAIAVDCRMLDIPLNIDYQLYNKRNNKFSIGTGLSSYIMTHESYQYTYADAAHAGAPGYTVSGTGKYLFSIMNLQATYQRQLNSKFGVNVQPYFKVPLSNIGYSQVKLQTLGVAVGVNWNINSLSKPK